MQKFKRFLSLTGRVIIILLAMSIFHKAEAGLILGAPAYLGLNNGLVGYWSFNGPDMEFKSNRAYDRSGQGNHGTLTNMSTTSSPVEGRIGQALSFDGVNDYVDLGNTASLRNIQTRTISFWAYIKSYAPVDSFTTVMSSLSGQSNWYIQTCSNDASECTSTANTFVWFFQGEGGTFREWYAPANSLPLNQWQHITIVYTCSAAGPPDFYVNGKKVTVTATAASGTPDCVNIDTTSTKEFGRINGGSFLNGLIDEVRVYNRALSADEVKRLYRIGATLKLGAPTYSDTLQKGLVGYWSFNGPDMAVGTNFITAYDRSGQGNNGLLYNMSTTTARVAGKIGQALKFDGIQSIVNINSTNNFPAINSAQTFSLWFNASDQTGSDNAGILLTTRLSAGGSANHLRLDETNGFIGMSQWGGATTISTTIPSYNTWHHFVWTNDGTRNSLYIDGVRQASNTTALQLGASEQFLMGNYLTGEASVLNYNGLLDEVRIYNRALTGDEIRRLYRIGGTLKIGAPTYSDSLQKGLVGYWSFNGGTIQPATNRVMDMSGNGNHGIMTNMSTTSSPTEGRIGQALKFDGVDDYVDSGTSATLSFTTATSQFTICGWAKAISFPSGITGLSIAGRWSAVNSRSYSFEIGNTTNPNKAELFLSTDGSSNTQSIVTTNTFTTTNWNHYCATADVGTDIFNIYVNGVNEATTGSTAVSSLFNNSSASFSIGAIKEGTDNMFDGLIDEVRIYNRALSPAEIQRLYNLGR